MSSAENGKSRVRLRQALYSALEAAVRENHQGPDNSTYSGRCAGGGDGGNREDGGNDTVLMPAMEYPSPLLWFEEITPADLDAYHASHLPINPTRNKVTRDNSRIMQSATGVVLGRTARAANPSQTTTLSDGPTNGDSECHERSWTRRNAMMAREEGFTAEHERAAGSGPESLSLFPCPGRVDVQVKESTCANDVDSSNIQPTLIARPPTVMGSAAVRDYNNHFERTEILRDKSKTQEVTPAFLVTPATPSIRRTQTMATPITNAVYECDSEQAKSSQQLRRTKSTTAAVDSTVSIPATHSGEPTQPTTSLTTAAAHQHNSVTQRQEHERTLACHLSQPHSEQSMAGSAAGPGRGTAHSEMPLPPSQLALSQQSVFSPGLPSQVVVTQQANNVDSLTWQHEEVDDEETLRSEYDHAMPSAPSSPTCAAMSPNSIVEEFEAIEAACVDRGRAAGALSASGRDHDAAAASASRARRDDPWSDGRCPEETSTSMRHGHQARALEHEAFTHALEQRFGDHESSRSECAGVWESDGDGLHCQQESAAFLLPSSSRSRQGKQRTIMVPTAEVLPSGIRGGQAGAVSLLEKNLTRVREKGVPEGYAARALEVACHVLRQPKVCVTVGRGSDGNDHENVHGWQKRNAAVPASDSHAQVVGITGIVWEILCAGDDCWQ